MTSSLDLEHGRCTLCTEMLLDHSMVMHLIYLLAKATELDLPVLENFKTNH